jgi:uncharacterized membrane protein YkvA (DUF1232 family)
MDSSSRLKATRRALRSTRRAIRRQTAFLNVITSFPRYVKLLLGMLGDSRVARFDRFLVVGSLVYLFSPFDLLPDVIPLLGQVDDLFVVVLAVSRLFERAPRGVTLSHWSGSPDELDPTALSKLLYLASFFAGPGRRRRLRRMAGVASGA